MARLCRPRSAATDLGRRRSLTAPVQLGPLVRLITERFAGTASDLWTDDDTVEVQVPRDEIVETLRALRDEPDFEFFFLADAAAVDYGPTNWFEVVYHLFSWKHAGWLRIRTRVDRKDPRIDTITGLWEGAMFHEREMFDMMGIVFEGNRDLRRIYMSPDYRSFPQRKDFILPDDAADSAAAGVKPLERPETWDLTRFSESLSVGETQSQPVPDGEGPEFEEISQESRPR